MLHCTTAPQQDAGPMAKPRYWNRAIRHLESRDPVLRRLIRRYPGERLESRGEPFVTLARAIVGQQISVKAADTLWRRLDAALGPVSPAALAAATPERLRAAGMSRQKSAYLADLGRRFAAGEVDPARWRRLDDEAVIEELTVIKGVGRWTAEMVLIFSLMRPDVLPLDDVGLRRAAALAYGREDALAKPELAALAEPWRPWRSVATWYLWRGLDPLPVSY
jgi:DNA-3-methyladenine glycosylase II